jgi:hypothetical protein
LSKPSALLQDNLRMFYRKNTIVFPEAQRASPAREKQQHYNRAITDAKTKSHRISGHAKLLNSRFGAS